MSALLEVKNLSVEYRTGNGVGHALNGIDMTIKRGEALGLVGETGAGKTTTALSILNLLPPRVSYITGGKILFDGKSVLQMSRKELEDYRGKKVSMIFQNPLSSLNPVFTVGEQIALVLRKHSGLSKGEIEEETKKLLRTVGIPDYRVKDYPHQLSGGMRQRVGIAAAMACNPELLIADEPTTALDVTIQAQVLELMRKLIKTKNSSLLMITHNMGIVAELCDTVAIIYGGRIVEYGSVKEVYSNPLHYYTRGLLGAIPKLTGERKRLVSIPGVVVNTQNLPGGCAFHPRCRHCEKTCPEIVPELVKVGENHFVSCWNLEEKA